MASHSPLAFIFLSEQQSVRNGRCYKANETSIITIQFIQSVYKIPAYFVYVQITCKIFFPTLVISLSFSI